MYSVFLDSVVSTFNLDDRTEKLPELHLSIWATEDPGDHR